MSLASQADELLQVLRSAVVCLKQFGHDHQQDYIRSLANRLCPLVAEFEAAVAVEHDRARAERVLSDICEVMQHVNGAATKGEMAIFADDTLARYWALSTIFRESRFSGESL